MMPNTSQFFSTALGADTKGPSHAASTSSSSTTSTSIPISTTSHSATPLNSLFSGLSTLMNLALGKKEIYEACDQINIISTSEKIMIQKAEKMHSTYVSLVKLQADVSTKCEIYKKAIARYHRPDIFPLLAVSNNNTSQTVYGMPIKDLQNQYLLSNMALGINQQQLPNIKNQATQKHLQFIELAKKIAAAQEALKVEDKKLTVLIEVGAKLQNQMHLDLKVLLQYQAFKILLTNLEPIIIQDIIVTHPKGSQMDGETTSTVTTPYFSRLIEQIKLAIEDSIKLHRGNCNADNTLKKSCENTITRRIYDEFSFYPSEFLTEAQYLSLLKEIYNRVKAAPPNIFLILATFPVLVNKILHNVLVHATSGPQAILDHRSKRIHGKEDFNYGFQLPIADTASIKSIKSTTMQPIDFNKPLIFDYGTLVYSTTAGGSCLLSNIELCVEHTASFGTFCLWNELFRVAKDQEIIPLQYSHIICSRTISRRDNNPYGIQRITHADSESCGIWAYSNKQYERHHTPASQETIKPVFGNSSSVTVQKPCLASFLPNAFFKFALKNNEQVVKQTIKPVITQGDFIKV